MPSTHVPPLRHGAGAHSLTFVRQFVPVKPGKHVHTYPPTMSAQAPPLRHGAPAQSLMFVAHATPEKPGKQTHFAVPLMSEHAPLPLHVRAAVVQSGVHEPFMSLS